MSARRRLVTRPPGPVPATRCKSTPSSRAETSRGWTRGNGGRCRVRCPRLRVRSGAAVGARCAFSDSDRRRRRRRGTGLGRRCLCGSRAAAGCRAGEAGGALEDDGGAGDAAGAFAGSDFGGAAVVLFAEGGGAGGSSARRGTADSSIMSSGCANFDGLALLDQDLFDSAGLRSGNLGDGFSRSRPPTQSGPPDHVTFVNVDGGISADSTPSEISGSLNSDARKCVYHRLSEPTKIVEAVAGPPGARAEINRLTRPCHLVLDDHGAAAIRAAVDSGGRRIQLSRDRCPGP